jgi:Ca2+-binding EF-hand superfamily protein
VYDYLDKEPDSPKGVWVDDYGRTLKEETLIHELQRETALKRSDLDAYMELYDKKFSKKSLAEIPEKFVSIDTDMDGYISFEELLKVIDDYFDFNVNLSLDELRQVNELFFSQ